MFEGCCPEWTSTRFALGQTQMILSFTYAETYWNVKSKTAVQHAFTITCERTRFNPIVDMLKELPD